MRLSVAVEDVSAYAWMMGSRGSRGIAGGIFAGVFAAAALLAPATASAQGTAERGWAQRALALQYKLAGDLPFIQTPWVGTHNSYNSTVQTGVSISARDANQRITNVAQLDAGIRSLELDVHRFPDLPGGPLRVCHGRGADQLHLGCTLEKQLGPTLAEIAAWLDSPAGRGQVLLLYLEDHMVDAAGYDAAAQIVSQRLGERLYAPGPGGCTEVPSGLTRNRIRAAGKQALIVSDCGPGTGWAEVAFNWDSHVESRPVGYQDFPDCGPDYDRATYESTFVRYYEDSTALTNVVGPPTGVATPDDGITPTTAAAMTRCGVDLIGLDQLTGPADPRLEAMVWSWAANRPAAPGTRPRRGCAIQRQARPATGGRSAWFDRICNRLRRPACRRANGSWRILPAARDQAGAKRACERRDLVLGAPRTGYESQLLAQAMSAAGAKHAWLGLRRRGATGARWVATDRR